MRCLEVNIPQVKKDLQELSSIFNNENIAYALLSKNNGYSLEFDLKGNPSELYSNLVEKYGSRKEALRNKSLIYSPDFLSVDNWLNEGEPSLESLETFKETNSKSYVNSGDYNSKSVIFLSTQDPTQTISEINKAIGKGVKVFTMPIVSLLTKNDSKLRDYLLSTHKFDYNEKDEVGFYTKPLTEKETRMVKTKKNVLKINDTTIDLRKIGINFKLSSDQLEAVQHAADWIDGKELKKKTSFYTGEITELKEKEVFVFDSTNYIKSKKFGRTENVIGFEAKKQGEQTYGIKTKDITKENIINQIKKLYSFAYGNPNGKFKVSTTDKTLAENFAMAGNIPNNVIFEKEFSKEVYKFVPNMSDANMLLTGYAGTGKTAITNVIIEYATNNFKPIVASAITSRAVRVQKEFYGNRIHSGTLHSVLGLRKDTGIEDFNLKSMKFSPQARPMVNSGSILIVDEASMTNNDLYEFLLDHSKQIDYRILFIGDNRQLKPVKQNTASRVFLGNDKFISPLTTQHRQTISNTLLDTLNKLRRNQKTSKQPLGSDRTSSINDTNTEGIEWTNKSNFLDNVNNLFKSNKFKDNPYYSRIIAYKNNTVTNYNLHVRKILGKQDEIEVGELITGYENKANFNKSIVENGADYIVISKKDIIKKFLHPLDSKKTIGVIGIEVDLQDASLGTNKSVFIMSRSNSDIVKEVVASMAYETLKKYHELRSKNSKAANSTYSAYANFQNSFQAFENLSIPGMYDRRTGEPVVHVKKAIDYGYAITSHKSQGGTYQYVLVDETDIDSIYQFDVESTNQAKYVAFSRAAKGVIANTNAIITNKRSFDLTEDIKVENIKIAESGSLAIKAMLKDDIAYKIC